MKKLLLTGIIIIEIFTLNIQQVNALGGLLNAGTGMVGISPAQILEQVAEDLRLPLDMARDLMKFGSSMQKKMAGITPTVETHFFPPRTPKIGEVMAIKAFPQNFSTEGESLHYIWALKHNDSNRNGSVDIPGVGERSVHNGNIDWNNSVDDPSTPNFCDDAENPDIQDCIIAATRMRAQGTTKPGGINRNFDYDNAPNDADNDGYKAMLGGYSEIQENSDYTNDIQGGDGASSWLNTNFPRGQRPPGPKCYVPDLKGSEVGGIFELASIGEENLRAQGDEDGQAVYSTEDGVCEDVVICASPAELDCGDFEDPGGDMGDASASANGGSGGDAGSGSGGGGGGGGGSSSSSVDLEMPDRVLTGLPYAVWADSGLDISCSIENNDDGDHTPICPEGTTPICLDERLLDPTNDDYPDCREIEDIANGTNEGSATISGGISPIDTFCFNDGRAGYRFAQPGASYCSGGACSITIEGTAYSIPNAGTRYDPGNGFLWKPVSEANGNLVVLVPSDDCSAGEAIRDLGKEIIECDANRNGVNGVNNQCEDAFYGLFPTPPGLDNPIKTGVLSTDYEKFFGLDPLNASTAGNGLTDGQNIAGLNADQFSWEYTPGDQVSLIVSGKSGLLGPHDDAKNMNMFALPKNNFSSFNFVEDANMYTIIDAEGHPRNIPTIPGMSDNGQSALLSSMDANWIDPSSGNQAKQIKVSIDYQPENPTASSVVGQSDILTLTANVEGIENGAKQLKYEWEIYTGSQKYVYAENMPAVDDDDKMWKKVDDEFLTCNDGDRTGLILQGPVNGIGLDTIRLNLNNLNNLHCGVNNDGVDRSHHKYILARVKINEYFNKSELYADTAGSLDSQIGFGDVMVKIDRSNSDFILTVNEGSPIDPIGSSGNVYPAINNQIITANMDIDNGGVMENIHWTLNGKTIDVAGDNTRVSFPVSGSIGDKFMINMIGNNLGMENGDLENAGDVVNITKTIIISEPHLIITLADATAMNNQTIGSYNFNGMDAENGVPDYRRSVLTFSGEAVDLTIDNDQTGSMEIPQTTPSYLPEMLDNIRWYADGVLQENCTGSGCNVNFPNARIGSFHTVSIEADYRPRNRQSLLKDYGISRYRSSGERLTTQVKLKVEAPAQAGQKKPVKIFASLIGNLPSQIMFLFRIMLTIAVVIAVPGFIFSFEKQKI